jgi:hypothetical protein
MTHDHGKMAAGWSRLPGLAGAGEAGEAGGDRVIHRESGIGPTTP